MLNKIKFGVAALTLGLGLLASTSPIEALSIEEIQEKYKEEVQKRVDAWFN